MLFIIYVIAMDNKFSYSKRKFNELDASQENNFLLFCFIVPILIINFIERIYLILNNKTREVSEKILLKPYQTMAIYVN